MRTPRLAPRRARRTHAAPRPIAPVAHIVAFALLLALANACVTDPQPDIPLDAIVTYETVRLRLADEDPTGATGGQLSGELATVGQPLVGERSDIRALGVGAMAGANFLLFSTLRAVETLSTIRPTSRSEDQWIWQGEGDDGVYNRFTLTHADDGADGPIYSYLFQRRLPSEGDDALAAAFDGSFEVLSGEDFNERVRTGQGILRFHFDDMKRFDPSGATGDASVAYRSRGGVRQIRVFLRDVSGDGLSEPLTAAYEYVQEADRSGAFVFESDADFLNDGLPRENLLIRSVWTPSGAGRSLSVVSGGSLTIDEAVVEECWDASGVTVWTDTIPDIASVEGGAESACDPALQGLVLERPTLPDPSVGDPAVPGPHPSEDAGVTP